MSDDVWQAKVDLAAALRLAAHFGLNEGIDNHFSYVTPGSAGADAGTFLLNPYGLHWSEVQASDIIEVGRDGKTVSGAGEAEVTAFCIHSRVHLRHPRAACVLHTHMPHATALAMIEDGALEPASQTALMFYNDVAYDDGYNGLGDTADEGDRIAGALGDKTVLFLRGHGVIVVGGTVAEAFQSLYYLERACQAQVLAMSTGKPLLRIGDNVAASTFGGGETVLRDHAAVHFNALKRLLDRRDTSYAR